MSYTIVKALWPGEKQEDLMELRNSHGSCTHIWNFMCMKYLGAREFDWISHIDELWPLWKRLDIPEYERAILMMTYDRAYVTRKDYLRAGADIRTWLNCNPIKGEYVNHWPSIAKLFEDDRDIPAIGLYCTSLSDDPFQGPWNEEKEEYEHPDWSDCYDLYVELDSLKS